MSAFDGASSDEGALMLPASSTDAEPMTAEERARHIHKVLCNHAKACSKPFTLWAELAPEKQQRLIAAAERLEREYHGAGDPPSRGMR